MIATDEAVRQGLHRGPVEARPHVEATMLDAFIIDQIRRREQEREGRQRPTAERPGAVDQPDGPAPAPADGWSAPRRSAPESTDGHRGVWSIDDDEDGAGFVIDM